jgi:hypothetical protein
MTKNDNDDNIEKEDEKEEMNSNFKKWVEKHFDLDDQDEMLNDFRSFSVN